MEIVQAKKQNVWGAPVVCNFIFGGLGGGLFVFFTLIQLTYEISSVVVNITAAILVLLGLAIVSLESQRPLRGIFVMNNLATSWMSREALAAIIFIFSVVINIFFENKLLAIITMFSALFFVISQGIIVYKSRAIPSWHNTNIPVLFLTTALCNGGATMLLFSISGQLDIASKMLIILVIFLSLNLTVWVSYLYFNSENNFLMSIRKLKSTKNKFMQLIIGHVLPILLILHLINVGSPDLYSWYIYELIMACFFILLTGILRIKNIILDVGYLVPMTIQTGN